VNQLSLPVSLPALAASAFVVSLVTAAVPGPLTLVASTLALRRTAAAVWFLAGVTALDVALFLALAGGAGPLLHRIGALPAVEIVGGFALLWAGAAALRKPPAPSGDDPGPELAQRGDPTYFVLGVAMSAGNPQYWLWWVTAGFAFVEAARAFGTDGLSWMLMALVGGVVGWYVALLTALHHGKRLVTPRFERFIREILGVVMILLGGGLVALGAWRF